MKNNSSARADAGLNPVAASPVANRVNRRQFIGTTATALAGFAGVGLTSAVENPKQKYLLGCYTRPWDQFDYRTALDGIAEAGFRYAGIMTAKGKTWVIVNADTTPEEIHTVANEVKQRGLQTISIYGGGFPVSESVEAGIAGLRKLIDHCAACSCPNLLLGGTTDSKVFADYYKVVAECCDYAAAKKVGLSIKPHGGQNATGPQCRRIIEQVAHQSFRLWYDPGNIFYYSDGNLDPVEDSATVDGLVAGVSIKDFTPPKEVLVTPGTGQVRFAEVMQRLHKGGFRSGPLVVECLKRAETARDITAEALKARMFVEELASSLE